LLLLLGQSIGAAALLQLLALFSKAFDQAIHRGGSLGNHHE
jgi:hypothetical protein